MIFLKIPMPIPHTQHSNWIAFGVVFLKDLQVMLRHTRDWGTLPKRTRTMRSKTLADILRCVGHSFSDVTPLVRCLLANYHIVIVETISSRIVTFYFTFAFNISDTLVLYIWIVMFNLPNNSLCRGTDKSAF